MASLSRAVVRCSGAAGLRLASTSSRAGAAVAQRAQMSETQPAAAPPHHGAVTNAMSHSNPASQLRKPIIDPRWWTGTNAVDLKKFEVDCSEFDLPSVAADIATEGRDAVPAALQEAMWDAFDREGIVVLRNTGLGDHMQAMRNTADVVVQGAMAYEGGANSRLQLDVNVFDTGAPASAALHYHHEMAYVTKSTQKVAFCCSASPGDGNGATYVSQATGSTDMLLSLPLGQKLKELGVSYIRNLTDVDAGGGSSLLDNSSTVYNDWQRSFGVDTMEEAEAEARKRGLEVAWGPGRFMRTRYSCSAFEYYPPLDRNLMYSAVADDSIWFDSWKAIAHQPTLESFETATPADRPLKLTFGDGSDLTRQELQQYVDVYDEYGVKIEWQKGDIMALCNWRWAHGRPAYTLKPGQERTLGVVLGEPFMRVGQRDDKW